MDLQKAGREHQEVYRALLESASDGVVLVDGHGQIVMVNRKAEHIFGYQRQELLGQKIDILVPETQRYLHKRHRGEYMSDPQPRPMAAGRELTGQRKDGSQFPIEVSLSPVNIQGETLVLSLVIDISDKVQAHKLAQIQQQQLMQADRMTTLGILVTGVAHEINNPNNFIMLNAGILKEVWRDIGPILEKHYKDEGDFKMAGMPFSRAYEKIDRLISGTSEGAERIKKIVESLKNFARQDHGELDQNVAINRLVESAVTITHNLIKRTTNRFSVDYGGNIPEFKGNCQQLEQVIINLITNSCQALSKSSDKLSITTSWMADKGQVVVVVADGGVGISEANIKHIFDPFFTTKRTSGGTGLGLSISYSIVQNHRGTLTFDSTPGEGTVATMSIPVVLNSREG